MGRAIVQETTALVDAFEIRHEAAIPSKQQIFKKKEQKSRIGNWPWGLANSDFQSKGR